MALLILFYFKTNGLGKFYLLMPLCSTSPLNFNCFNFFKFLFSKQSFTLNVCHYGSLPRSNLITTALEMFNFLLIE